MRLSIFPIVLFTMTVFSFLIADNSNAQQVAYAWADKPASANYAPSTQYAYNHSGGINIKRNDTGSYTVNFNGFGGGTRGGNVQVTAYGTSRNTCHVVNWNYRNNNTNFAVNVRCFSLNGTPVDSMYTVLVTK